MTFGNINRSKANEKCYSNFHTKFIVINQSGLCLSFTNINSCNYYLCRWYLMYEYIPA